MATVAGVCGETLSYVRNPPHFKDKD
ncbi:hypothetical protein MIMGU_mgv1a0031692mg, partial [Erythranthe guttata]